MRTFARALCLLLCLVFPAQQAAALAVPACEHAGGAETPEAVTPEAVTPETSHDHHAMHGGETMPPAKSGERTGGCECGCPCAMGACLHVSSVAAMVGGLAPAGMRFTPELPSFKDAAHAPAAAAVALRPPISA
ncbi:MAG TPA: hypothetical protein VND91_02500 [Candidatus Saccharimonadia bacterium]|nr:hypothetical protein [Candidatus Saccharimonadia bacterium]